MESTGRTRQTEHVTGTGMAQLAIDRHAASATRPAVAPASTSQEGIMAHAHAHDYQDHPTWATHVACRTCGFSSPRRLLAYAIEHGATYVPATAQADDMLGPIYDAVSCTRDGDFAPGQDGNCRECGYPNAEHTIVRVKSEARQ